ncbi:DNA mismatch repair protein msh6 [Rhizophlyctis rosea]|uniref:DNA mismatch repair protein n=1 Tax=Rhizophlyctis rosea TaxID=64517 RepID=A0AAD5SIJ8_9FUNG|nr:DNA mismatch repair protein msh6 [Rhizophlyctis rosea]
MSSKENTGPTPKKMPKSTKGPGKKPSTPSTGKQMNITSFFSGSSQGKTTPQERPTPVAGRRASILSPAEDNPKSFSLPSPSPAVPSRITTPQTPPDSVLSSPSARSVRGRAAGMRSMPPLVEEADEDGDITMDPGLAYEEPKSSGRSVRKRPRALYVESDDDSEAAETPTKAKKSRGRVVLSDESDQDEYKPDANENGNDEEDDKEMAIAVDDLASEDEAPLSSFRKPPKKNPKLAERQSSMSTSTPTTPSTPTNRLQQFKLSTSSVKRAASFPSPSEPDAKKSRTAETKAKYDFMSPSDADAKKSRTAEKKAKNETRYAWLQDVKDKERRSPDDPEYDPRTLHIPKLAWSEFTAFERQFWEIKRDHWDTVVFFKKGKFYELYEKDADIGHQVFDLKMTDRVNMRMVGVPESSFEEWAGKFIAKGYRVARVDQMENAVGKAIRDKQAAKKVQFFIVSIFQSTIREPHAEARQLLQEDKVLRRELRCVLTPGTLTDASLLTSDMNTYCMSIKEQVTAEHESPSFGICFVDTATAEFSVCHFEDDVNRTKFETLVLQLKPKEVVVEKGMMSKITARVLKNSLTEPQYNHLMPEKEFWDAEVTLDELRAGGYFEGATDERKQQEDEEIGVEGDDGRLATWPPVLRKIASEPLAMSAVGGLVSYLRTLLLDKELVSARNFHLYDPVRHTGTLILDGQTLKNLEMFENTTDGTEEGTLFKLLCRCDTAFGKRLFKRWLCHPLRSIQAIRERLDAVDDLQAISGHQENLRATLRKIPDLERTISRIHSNTCKVKEFVGALGAFEALLDLLESTEPYVADFRSPRLVQLFHLGAIDKLKQRLEWFDKAFDHAEALKATDDLIRLHGGYDDVYDSAVKDREDLQTQLEQCREKHARELKCKITFKDIGKEKYTMEIAANVNVPINWKRCSVTKAVRRWYSPEVEKLVQEFVEAQEIEEQALREIKTRLCQRFDEGYEEWLQLIKAVAEIDCLMSLGACRRDLGEPLCRPEFLDGDVPTFEVEELRHPCIIQSAGSSYIPNDTYLGGEGLKPNVILLTGPNMGGKSTLLRQTCIAVIMAQLGCHVPARSCRLTPVDRIFTRIGANDNILAGQSTFMVELSETSKILREATPRSLVILDELGRGTSTFDGYAIAYSVLHHLATRTRCVGLFSTHYGMLTQDFEKHPLVAKMYMDYFADKDKRDITFLYKLRHGSCPKSYGMNVASMAGVPVEVVDRADNVAAEFENHQRLRQVRSNAVESNMMHQADFAYMMRALGTGKGIRGEVGQVVKAIWKGLQKD